MRTSAFICVHLRSFADTCGHLRSLKNRSVLGHHFLCAGTVLGSPTCQNPRAHRSNLTPSKVVVLPTRNDSFQKHMSFYLREMQVSERWMCLRMAQGPYGSREARTVNASFRRSRIHAGSMKIMENDRNMTHMALLGLKLGQNEWQRSCEFNAKPPESPKPHKKFKMADFGPTGERPTNHIKNSISNSQSTA